MTDVAVVSTFPPRRCGIATFSRDLCDALDDSGRLRTHVVAIDEPGVPAAYPARVRWRLVDRAATDYERVAAALGESAIDAVLVQHEYGLFGGDAAGDMLLSLLDGLRCPVVTTLHTVLSRPDRPVRDVTRRICARSAAVVVAGPVSAGTLAERYEVDSTKIVQIPHGVPHPVEPPPGRVAAADSRPVVMSFGFLGPNKGIHQALVGVRAMVAGVPRMRYRIVGTAHPGEIRRAGDAYRGELGRLVRQLGIEQHVEFIDRYVSDRELNRLLGEAAICLLPYTEPDQAVSGTLARALGAGRAVVATAFRHAVEVAEHGGVHLVPMRQPGAIAAAVLRLLTEPEYRRRLEAGAWAVSARMRWGTVARSYERVLLDVVRGGHRP
jgi:glycosyltransferase involved in cell wall biosynthesis